jgi:hypothetical protein
MAMPLLLRVIFTGGLRGVASRHHPPEPQHLATWIGRGLHVVRVTRLGARNTKSNADFNAAGMARSRCLMPARQIPSCSRIKWRGASFYGKASQIHRT